MTGTWDFCAQGLAPVPRVECGIPVEMFWDVQGQLEVRVLAQIEINSVSPTLIASLGFVDAKLVSDHVEDAAR